MLSVQIHARFCSQLLLSPSLRCPPNSVWLPIAAVCALSSLMLTSSPHDLTPSPLYRKCRHRDPLYTCCPGCSPIDLLFSAGSMRPSRLLMTFVPGILCTHGGTLCPSLTMPQTNNSLRLRASSQATSTVFDTKLFFTRYQCIHHVHLTVVFVLPLL